MLCYVSALLRGPFRLLDPHTDRRLGVVRVKPDTPLLTTPLSSPFRSHSCDPTAASSLAGETSTSHLHDSRIFFSPSSTSSYSLLSKLTRAVFFPPPDRYPVNVSVESPPARSETSTVTPESATLSRLRIIEQITAIHQILANCGIVPAALSPYQSYIDGDHYGSATSRHTYSDAQVRVPSSLTLACQYYCWSKEKKRSIRTEVLCGCEG